MEPTDPGATPFGLFSTAKMCMIIVKLLTGMCVCTISVYNVPHAYELFCWFQYLTFTV